MFSPASSNKTGDFTVKKFLSAVLTSLAITASVNANAAVLNIVWTNPDGINVHETVTLNPNGTFTAGAFTGTWSVDGSLIKIIGRPCSYTYPTQRFVLTGTLLSSNPIIYGGSANCSNNIVGGGPTYNGSWTYQ